MSIASFIGTLSAMEERRTTPLLTETPSSPRETDSRSSELSAFKGKSQLVPRPPSRRPASTTSSAGSEAKKFSAVNRNYQDLDGRTALHRAILKTVTDPEIIAIMVQGLLQCHADPAIIDNKGEQPLHYAAEKGYKNLVHMLVRYGAQIDCKDKNGLEPIHHAAAKGHLPFIKELASLDNSCIRKLDAQEKRPIHYAAKNGKLQTVKYLLLKAPETIRTLDKQGFSPLDHAFLAQQKSTTHYLWNRYTQVGLIPFNNHGFTPWHEAAAQNNIEAFEDFLKDTDLDGVLALKDLGFSKTVTHVAADFGSLQVLEHLLDYGANPNDIDEKQRTPLYLALDKRIPENVIAIAKCLVDHGACLHHKDRRGETPLDWVKRTIKVRLQRKKRNQIDPQISLLQDFKNYLETAKCSHVDAHFIEVKPSNGRCTIL